MPFTRLVIEGAAVKGVVVIGVMQAMAESKSGTTSLEPITHVYGTSSGAILATFVALGMSPQKIVDTYAQFHMIRLLDVIDPMAIGKPHLDTPQDRNIIFGAIRSFITATEFLGGVADPVLATLLGTLSDRVQLIRSGGISPAALAEAVVSNVRNSTAELADILRNPEQLNQAMSKLSEFLNIIQTTKNVTRGAGLCEGIYLINWMQDAIRDQIISKLGGESKFITTLRDHRINDSAMIQSIRTGRITFGQLNKLKVTFGAALFKNLTVVATQIAIPLIARDFSTLSDEHQDVPIVDAVRGSMSIPGIFKVFEIKNIRGQSFGYFTDGGTLRNLPLPRTKNGLDLSVLANTLIIRCNDPAKVIQDQLDFPLYAFFNRQPEARTLKLYADAHPGYAETHVITADTSALPYVDFLADEQGAIIKRSIQNGALATARIYPRLVPQEKIPLPNFGLVASRTSATWWAKRDIDRTQTGTTEESMSSKVLKARL